jgi:hypothetical protein
MELRARTLFRAATMASLGALLVPAAAGAATHKTYRPTITSISPRILNVGDRLTVHGKHFRRGVRKNTVVFQRSGHRAVFVRAALSTTRVLYVTIPSSVAKALKVSGSTPVRTRFHLRVMTTRLGRQFTAGRLSPQIGPRQTSAKPGNSGPAIVSPKPTGDAASGDCDHDGIANGVDTDDDNDGLADTTELKYGLQPCNPDSDGDGVSDGFEFQSALDLNNDDYQHPNGTVPYPGKRPYPNPRDGSDADTDFDGDGLTMAIEYRLWRYSVAHNGAPNSIYALSYSDGLKYSIYTRDGAANNRRVPNLSATNYPEGNQFLNWATVNGYADIQFPDDPGTLWALTDFDRDGAPAAGLAQPTTFYDTHGELNGSAPDGFLSDDERDEDADGLSNYAETIGPLQGQSWWSAFYPNEKAFTQVDWPGTQVDNPDSDGDSVLDGADDQDHDDYPNIVEVSRARVVGGAFPLPSFGRVNPFNPCLPNIHSRSCPTYNPVNGWAPFDGSPNYDIVQ